MLPRPIRYMELREDKASTRPAARARCSLAARREALGGRNRARECRRGLLARDVRALVAHHQAATAGDRSIASAMHAIAADETEHAGLAWDVAAWLEPQLDPEEPRETFLAT